MTLNNLFYTTTDQFEVSEEFPRTFLPTMTLNTLDTPGLDHIYMVVANISHNAPHPAWTTPVMYFLPFGTKDRPQRKEAKHYIPLTIGLGVNVKCSELEWEDPASVRLGHIIAQPEIHDLHETRVHCIRTWNTYFDSSARSNGSLELLGPLLPSSSENASEFEHQICGSILAVGFLRATLNANEEDADTIFTSSTWMTCTSTIFNEVFSDRVNASKRVEEFESYVDAPDSNQTITYASNSSSMLSSLYKALDFSLN